jgi:hypothetical protein
MHRSNRRKDNERITIGGAPEVIKDNLVSPLRSSWCPCTPLMAELRLVTSEIGHLLHIGLVFSCATKTTLSVKTHCCQYGLQSMCVDDHRYGLVRHRADLIDNSRPFGSLCPLVTPLDIMNIAVLPPPFAIM